MHTLIIGAGFSGSRIAQHLLQKQWQVSVTRRHAHSMASLTAAGAAALTFDTQLNDSLRESLATTTNLVISVPPARQAPFNDPVLESFKVLRGSDLPLLKSVTYLSTIGVYGDHQGQWVDESTACISIQQRSIARLQAEQGWMAWCDAIDIPISVLRLSGIYGPGRNALADAQQGRARILIKPQQVFNRIHVDDIAQASRLAAEHCYNGTLNISDDLPAAPQDVVRYAHDLLQLAYPPEQDFATAPISDMARSFYSENKRVSNAMSKSELGLNYQFPDYRHGLDALYQQLVKGTSLAH